MFFFLNVMTHVFHILVTNLAQNKCVFFTSALFSQVCYLERVLCSCISRAWNETNVYSRSQRKRGHKGSARSAIERTRSLPTRRCERTHRYRREADVSYGTFSPLHLRKSQGCINNDRDRGDPAELSPQAAGGGSFTGARDIRRNGSGRVPGFAD